MATDFNYDVFLSYSSRDRSIVRSIAERLKKNGLNVWFDDWLVKPGDHIHARIEEGLENSRVLVLCMSENAFGSDWAKLESYTFRFRDPLNVERRFIPLRIDRFPVKSSLSQFRYIDWCSEDIEAEYAKLLQACQVTNFHEKSSVSLYLDDLKSIDSCSSLVTDLSIKIKRHPDLGNVLLIGDEIQHVEAWAPIYHEHLVHLSSSYVPSIKTALILGGGSLYAAQEVLKYPSVERVLLIDRDMQVIKAVERHYRHAKAVIGDPRLEIICEDAFAFLARTTLKFDLIVNDAMELYEPSAIPMRRYHQLEERLTAAGVCCDVIYKHIFERQTTQNILQSLQADFKFALSLIAVPEYPGIYHILTIWGRSNEIHQLNSSIANLDQNNWISEGHSPCEWYSFAHKSFYLYLPPYIKAFVGDAVFDN